MPAQAGAVATVDLAMQQHRSLLQENATEYAKYRTTFENWDYFYTAVALAEGTVGITQLVRSVKVVNSLNRFKTSVKFPYLCPRKVINIKS